VVRTTATVSMTAAVNRGLHTVIAEGLGRTCVCIRTSSARQDRPTRARQNTGNKCRQTRRGCRPIRSMGDLGRPGHDVDETQCANCYLRVHEFQRLTGAVEHAAHVDVPPLKPVLVAEIAGDTEELAAWGDHVPVVRIAPYLSGLGGAQRLSHASEGYPRWPGKSVHRLSPTTVEEEPTTSGGPMRRTTRLSSMTCGAMVRSKECGVQQN
jgi:hypothetical protein